MSRDWDGDAREACAANNVDWYVAVVRPHGAEWALERGMWVCRGGVPPYYSNAVTLLPGPLSEQIVTIRDLVATLERPFTVKDSYARLDLAPLGFEVLFDAEWVRRDPSQPPSQVDEIGVEWRTVTTAADLESWEAAWRDGGSPAETRVFLPAMLGDPAVRFVAAHGAGRIVAGCALNRSREAVGFSNFFAADADDEVLLAGAVSQATRLAPDLPVVGYEWGASLDRILRAGFRSVGPLRVWIRAGSVSAGG